MKIRVVPAKAGTHGGWGERWIPAFAGMTSPGVIFGGAERWRSDAPSSGGGPRVAVSSTSYPPRVPKYSTPICPSAYLPLLLHSWTSRPKQRVGTTGREHERKQGKASRHNVCGRAYNLLPLNRIILAYAVGLVK